MFCPNCGNAIPDQAVMCTRCGVPIRTLPTQPPVAPAPVGYASYGTTGPPSRSRLAAGLLGIFLGGMGIHRFYLGYTGIGILQIVVTFLTCGVGHFWGVI